VVETIEDFAGMKDSRSGLLPDHTRDQLQHLVDPVGGTRSLNLHENHIGEHYRQMGLNAPLTSLKLNYAAKGSPQCARYRARIDEPPKMLRRSAVAPLEVSI
jgi:hypothetical protein